MEATTEPARHGLRLALLLCCCTACGSSDASGQAAATGGGDGGGPSVARPDAGLGSWACNPGELLLDDGSCLVAGVEPDACAPGFVADGARGCEPVLPAEPCPSGTMALMGETSCRAVAPCGSGSWGAIPVDASTEHVDGSYPNGDSDGSAQRPWTTIQAGIDAAAPGAIVAVAAGSYPENVAFGGKAVRLWGRCPELVEIRPAGGVAIDVDADGSEVRDLALSTPGAVGIRVGSATGVILDRLWVHDVGFLGIDIEGGNPAATVSGSLVERVAGTGIFGYGATITVEDTVVRDIAARASDGAFGEGIRVWDDNSAVPTVLTVQRSSIFRTHTAGVLARGSQLTMEASVVRDVEPNVAERLSGSGVWLRHSQVDGHAASGSVSASHITRVHEAGILFTNSGGTVTTTVVRDVRSADPAMPFAVGMAISETADAADKSLLAVRSCLVEDTEVYGIVGVNADVQVEACVVRDTRAIDTGLMAGGLDVGGRGIGVESLTPGERPRLEVRGALVQRTHEIGLGVLGGDLVAESTHVEDVAVRATDGLMGRGIAIQLAVESGAAATAEVRDCLVERAHDHGLMVMDSLAHVSSTWIRDTLPARDGTFGRGVGLQGGMYTTFPVEMDLERVVIERSHEAGLFVAGANASLSHSVVSATTPQEANGLFGDGIIVLPMPTEPPYPARLDIRESVIESSSRVGIGAWGADVSIAATLLSCNTIDLNGEAFLMKPFGFVDNGGNECACDEQVWTCRVQSTMLSPPDPSSL